MTKSELETCINEYGTDVYSFCRHLTCSLQEAEDLYQDTFLKAIELREKIDKKENPKSYLLSIALRIWKNKKRKYAWRMRIADIRPIQAEWQDAKAGGEPSLEEQFLSKEEKEAVRRSVEKLPERLKIIVLLYYMEELSVAQVAAAARIPAGTVKSRLHQARKLLVKELEDVLNEKGNR